jgi:hypothetical protein
MVSYQGRFDGACGFYAVVNAVAALYPCQFNRRELFTHIASTKPHAFCLGLGRNELNEVIGEACDYLERQGHALAVSRFWNRNPMALGDYWSEIRATVDYRERRTVAIVGFEFDNPEGEREGHWTVVLRATERTLMLADSSGRARLVRRHCAIKPRTGRGKRRNRICPNDTFIFAAVNGNGAHAGR